MKRRRFLQQLSTLPVLALANGARNAWAGDAGWRTFDLTTQIEPDSPSGATQLWIPVPAPESSGYQRRLGIRWEASSRGDCTFLCAERTNRLAISAA